MKMTRKVLSVILALVLAFSAFALVPSALAPKSAADLFISCDKTSYKPGDTITFTISQQVIPEVGPVRNGGTYPIAYNNVFLEPISTDIEDLAPHNFKYLIPEGYDDTIDSPVVFTGAIEAAGAAKYGWNDSFIVQPTDDGVVEIDNTVKKDFFQFDMKIKADAPEGDYVVGFNQQSFEDYEGIIQTRDGLLYGFYDDLGFGTEQAYTLGTCTVHVGDDAPATSPLNRLNTQYKLDANGNDFALRTTSSISVEDMASLVGSSDADTIKTNVKYLGFVATDDAKVDPKGVQAALEAADGKAVYNGKTYVVGTTNTLVATGTDFQFRAMLSSAKTRIPAEGLKLQSFIQKTDDTFTFYAADLNLTADMIK